MNLLFSNDRRGVYPDSWYTATTIQLPECDPLRGDMRADLCVIGGGYTGLWAALQAAQDGRDVVLVDAQRVGFGASGRNGGQVGTGFNTAQSSLERKLGSQDARDLWEMAEAAKRQVLEFCQAYAPETDYRAGVIQAIWHERDTRASFEEADYLRLRFGYDQITPLDRAQISQVTGSQVFAGGLLDHGAGHLHPFRYAIALARVAKSAGVRIFEQSRVHRLTEGPPAIVHCDDGKIHAKDVIIATNGYGSGLHRRLSARVMPINNFMVATEPLGSLGSEILTQNHAVADDKFVVNYFRKSEDGRLLFGGGESYGYKFPSDITGLVRPAIERVYPQLKGIRIDHSWGGTLAITMSRLPFVARLAPNILCAAGYSGQGVALSGFVGRLLAQALVSDSPSLRLLDRLPTRPFPGGPALRSPLLALAMTWYATRDKLGL
ncbi:MAG: FAD-binding oxidoreductase [Pseudomonadota bacterium]